MLNRSSVQQRIQEFTIKNQNTQNQQPEDGSAPTQVVQDVLALAEHEDEMSPLFTPNPNPGANNQYTTNFQQRDQLDFSNISRISGENQVATDDCQSPTGQLFPHPESQNAQAQDHAQGQSQDQQRIIQNIKIDQSTNNVYNFYNYGGNNY